MVSNEINYPFILVNLKSYSETLGAKAEELAEITKQVSNETGICIGLAPQFTDIPRLIRFKIPIFSQHIDSILPGAYTGHILAEAVKSSGSAGTILNHSEKRLLLSDIESVIKRTKEVGLISLVCANTTVVGMAVAAFDPDIIAIEPPELIGTGVAVSKAKPEIISKSVEAIKRINKNVILLCGAGITCGEDVYSSIKLGSSGVLVASGIVKSSNWKKILQEFATAASKAKT
ncbi:triose-phosphate isomerase [[Eubacterium] cellulosolvens]